MIPQELTQILHSKQIISKDSINAFTHFMDHMLKDKDARKLGILLIINLICTLLELIYGFLSNSISLISDAAHMLFDSTALAVGIYASYKATLPSNKKFSYGYERVQTLSGLINGIFLIFIAFYIFIESLERIYNPPVIQVQKMIVVAIIGLIVNVVGVTFFHEHAHFEGIDGGHSCSHHHHAKETKKQDNGDSHSHCSSHNHSHKHKKPHSHPHVTSVTADSHTHELVSASQGSVRRRTSLESSLKTKEHKHECQGHKHHDHHHDHHDHHHDHHDHSHDHKHKCEGHKHDNHVHHHSHTHESHSHNENLYGVYLHIMADLWGSIGVICSSILIVMFDLYIADAICSAVTSILILASIVPLLKSSSLIFMQTYPTRHGKGFQQVLSEISHYPGVIECRNPHLWALTHDKLVCSLVLVIKQSSEDVSKVLDFAKDKLQSIKGMSHVTVDYKLKSC